MIIKISVDSIDELKSYKEAILNVLGKVMLDNCDDPLKKDIKSVYKLLGLLPPYTLNAKGIGDEIELETPPNNQFPKSYALPPDTKLNETMICEFSDLIDTVDIKLLRKHFRRIVVHFVSTESEALPHEFPRFLTELPIICEFMEVIEEELQMESTKELKGILI